MTGKEARLLLFAPEGEDRITEALLYLPREPVEQKLGLLLGLALRRQVNLDVGVGEEYRRLRVLVLRVDGRDALVHGRLAEARDPQHATRDAHAARARRDTRQDVCVEHRLHLARRAGQKCHDA